MVWKNSVKEAMFDHVGMSLRGSKSADYNQYPRDRRSLFVYGEHSDAVQKHCVKAFDVAMAAHIDPDRFLLLDGWRTRRLELLKARNASRVLLNSEDSFETS